MEAVKELTRLRERIQLQLRELQSELDAIDKAVQLLEREGRRSASSVNEKQFAKFGLSDAVRKIVGDEWISPTEVRDVLMQGGYPNKGKGKLLGSVFATLKRLGIGNKAEFEMKRIDDKIKYRKKQPTEIVSAEAA